MMGSKVLTNEQAIGGGVIQLTAIKGNLGVVWRLIGGASPAVCS